MKAAIPQLMAAMPSDVNLLIANDRTTTIRTSLHDTEETLLIAVGLVTVVVFLFLRSARATLIPAIAVPVSIIGTFGTMYLLGYSLDNLSLMALTVATGFVVDDAIVVLENISRHIEDGMPRVQAALLGAREVGFTVISISVSLIAVFLPILLMGGIVGRLFREFAVTLSMALLVSLAISLATTPMMCAFLLKPSDRQKPKRRTLFDRALTAYERSLAWSLRLSLLVIVVLFVTMGLNVALWVIVPKGFIPQQDTGRMLGGLQADQSISFQAMQGKLQQLSDIVQHDPAVQTVVGFTGAGGGGGAGSTNTGSVFVALKPLSERDGIDVVMTRLRRALSRVPGARLFLIPIQDIGAGGRQSNAAYQYTLQADNTATLRMGAQAGHRPGTRQDAARRQFRSAAEGPGNGPCDRPGQRQPPRHHRLADRQHAYDAFGQRQVSTIYSAQNQYHVIMEVAPRYWQSPETLRDIYVSTAGGNAAGTETSNAVVGTVSSSKSSSANASAAAIASSSARNAATNALANVGKGSASSAPAVSTSKETMIPLASFTSFGPGSTALSGQPPGVVRRQHDLLQSGARRFAERRHRLGRPRYPGHPHAGLDPRLLRRHRPGVPAIAEQRADPDRHRPDRHLHRAGRAL